MNSNQVGGIVRAVIPAALAYAVAKGWLPASTVADVTAAVVTIAAAAWSVFTNATGTVIK